MRRLLVCALLLAACEAGNLVLPEPPAAPGPGTLYGRVVLAVPGRMERVAAADAQLQVLGSSLETRADAEGRFLLSGVVQEDGVLLVRHDADGDGTFERQRIVELAGLGLGAGRQIGLGELSIGENATVAGVVVRGDHRWESGGHAGTTVFVPAGPFTAHTNDDGSFVLPELPSGSLRFTVFRAGYVPQTFDGIELRAGEEFRVRDVVLQPETGEPAPGAIDGRVLLVPVDAFGGTTVAAIDTAGVTRTGEVQADGTFRIGGLVPHLYDVVVARAGYSTAVVANVLVRSAESVLLPPTVLVAGTSAGCLDGKECSVPTTCRLGRTDCSSGAPVCVEREDAPDGTPCGLALVCLDGACVECNAGAICTPDNACHVGIVSCENGREQCNDTGVPQPNGASCGEGSVCRAGRCGACGAGEACTPTNPCHEGSIACTTGEPVCGDTLTPKADGTPCGDELVCASGVCLPCVAGASCTFAANPCHAGRVACGTGRPVCEDGGANAADGSPCGDGLVCDDGACRACAAGSACTPEDPCHRGALACDTGAPVCVDLGASAPNGTACGDGEVCLAGSCVPCAEGSSCVPDASCHVGRVSCVTGEAACIDLLSNRPDGTQCGALAACVSGACLPCNEGAACTTVAHPCHAGAVSCAAGVPSCEDTGENLANGTACGSNLVCSLGACRSCAAGAACAPANPCHVGAVACGSGEPVCVDTEALAADGTGCGDGLVCHAGACVACDEGAACVPDGEACHVGRVSCASGEAVCVDTLENLANGTGCGDGLVCGAGTCAPCSAGSDCTPPASGCHVGAVACASGAPVCEDTSVARADGTGCGDARVCLAGTCVACTSGEACTPADVCHVGVSSCATGRPTCTDTGAVKPNGSPCGSGRVCSAGLCKPSGFSLSSGDAQSVPVGQLGGAVVVLLLDGAGQPIEGADVTIASPSGATTIPATAKTTAAGRVTFFPRMPRQPGTVRFTVSAPGKGELVVTATATKPPTGHVYPIVNVERLSGNDRTVLPGTVARIGVVSDVVAAADGTLYLADATNHTVRRLTPDGVLSVFAGSGQYGSTGDGGAAMAAKLYEPSALALDEVRGQLFIAEFYGHRVRRVDLATGVITTLAGGGTAGAPGYGDYGPASSANLDRPTSLALGPDGMLYVTDAGHDRLRRIDLETEVVTTFLQGTYPGACGSSQLVFAGCGIYLGGSQGFGGCSVTWDAAGNAYVSGSLSGLAPAGGCGTTPGIVRVDKGTGALAHVAGRTSAGSASGRPATDFTFAQPPFLAIDAQDNLLLTDRDNHVLRRIEARTGRVLTFGGTGAAGSGGDLGPVANATFNLPRRVRVDREGNLLVADGDNRSVRVVSNGLPSTSGATLSIVSGDGQSAPVNQALANVLAVRLIDGEGVPLSGYTVQWRALDPGAAVLLAPTRTDVNGVASTSVRIGRTPGAYRVEASFLDAAGRHAAGSPATLTVTATAPAVGIVFPLVNVDRIAGDAGVPGAGSMARVGEVMGMAVASDGSIYVADRTKHRVRKVAPDGGITNVAGTGSSGATGDGGPATQAQLDNPVSLLLDETRRRLYVAEFLHVGRIRVINLDTGIVSLFAGTGAQTTAPYGDGLPATSASLSYPSQLARGADGAVYVADQNHDRIRRIDPATGVISSWLQPSTGSCYAGEAVVFHGCGFNVSYGIGYGGCSVVWDAAGNAFVSGQLSGAAVGTCSVSPGIARRAPDGTLFHVAGRYGGTSLDRMAARETLLAGPPHLLFDTAGNLLLTTWEGHTVHRLEAATGRLSLLAGGAQGFAGDWAPLADARFKNPFAAARDESGHLYVSDSNNVQLRQVWKGAVGVAGGATLSVARGQGQSVRVGQFPPVSLGAKLVDGAGQPLAGHAVAWSVVDPGGHLYATTVATDVSGTSFVLPRAGLKPGTYRFRAAYADIAGRPVTGSPLEFSLLATAPPAGTIFTAVNVDRTAGNLGAPGAATVARLRDPRGVVVAADGTVYFADAGNHQVKRLSPEGHLTLVAGNGDQGYAGDGGPATSARLAWPQGLALDEAGGRLFIADHSNHRVRWVDLASGAIYTFAGGGTAGAPDWGDGGPASNATLDRPGHLSWGPDGTLYFGDGYHRRLRRVDPDGRITTVLPKSSTACSLSGAGATPLVFFSTGDPSYTMSYGSVAWDDEVPPNMYVAGVIGGTQVGSCSQFYGVVKLQGGPDGAMTHVAGAGTGAFANGADPRAVRFFGSPSLAFVNGELHVAIPETHDLWKISSAGTLVRVAGTGTAGFAGDMAPATGALLNRPFALTPHPGGGLLFSDSANDILRVVW